MNDVCRKEVCDGTDISGIVLGMNPFSIFVLTQFLFTSLC